MATFFKTTGNVVGTADVDTLVADYSTLTATYPYGIHLNINGEQNIRDRGPGTPILTYSSIEQFNVTRPTLSSIGHDSTLFWLRST